MVGKNILGPSHLPVLGAFTSSNVLLAFDYDGTLAPIAASPERVRMRLRTQRLLAQVAKRYPCVVISGRSLEDISSRLNGIPLWYVFGNHGLEPASAGRRADYASNTRQWMRLLHEHLPPGRGVRIENKRYSITLHYRHARNKQRAISAIEEALRHLPDTRAIGGKQAVSLLPQDGAHKGIALQNARRLFACDLAVYVGDDNTDEDAFGSAAADRLLSIRVGPAPGSRATYRLRGQVEIDDLLRAFLELREPCRLPSAGQAAEHR